MLSPLGLKSAAPINIGAALERLILAGQELIDLFELFDTTTLKERLHLFRGSEVVFLASGVWISTLIEIDLIDRQLIDVRFEPDLEP